MRINPVGVNYAKSVCKSNCKPIREVTLPEPVKEELSFKGKHTYIKAFTGIFGALGTAGAVGGTLIMTGGLILPVIAGYGAACALAGTAYGAMFDSLANKEDEDETNNGNTKKG